MCHLSSNKEALERDAVCPVCPRAPGACPTDEEGDTDIGVTVGGGRLRKVNPELGKVSHDTFLRVG